MKIGSFVKLNNDVIVQIIAYSRVKGIYITEDKIGNIFPYSKDGKFLGFKPDTNLDNDIKKEYLK